MTKVVEGWGLDIERGPDWIFVRLHPPPTGSSDAPTSGSDATSLADDLAAVLQQHMARRLVLEMDDVPFLSSHFIGELALLFQRIQATGGVMRLCGLTLENQEALRLSGLDRQFPLFLDRGEAVRGEAGQRSAIRPR